MLLFSRLLILRLLIYGFLPTVIRTTVDVPVVTRTRLSRLSSGGNIVANKSTFKATADLRSGDHFSCGTDSICVSRESTSTCTPTLMLAGTSSCSPSGNGTFTLGNLCFAVTLCQCAARRASSISTSSFADSSSSNTPSNSYSVPWNGTNDWIKPRYLEPSWVSDLGVRRRANWSLASPISFLNKSVSWCAARARINAFEAAVRALEASFSAFPRDSSAFPALVNASVACESALDESNTAVFAFLSACAALSPSEPMTFPESSFVLMRHLSPTVKARISTIVDQVPMCFLMFSGSPVKKSATSSPAQPTITKPSETYSATSQRWSKDATSDDTKIIFVHLHR